MLQYLQTGWLVIFVKAAVVQINVSVHTFIIDMDSVQKQKIWKH